MSYEPSVWKDGDLISAEKLNNIENGISDISGGGGGLVVECTLHYDAGQGSGYFITQTLATDIIAAIKNGRNVVVHIDGYDTGLGVPNIYFTPIYIERDGYSGDLINRFDIPDLSFNGIGSLMEGMIGEDGYVHFGIYVE